MNKLSVIAIQTLLGTRITGSYDSDTNRAVKDFQRKNGLIQDGIVGAKTSKAIASAIMDKTRSNQRYLVDRVITSGKPKLRATWIFDRIKSMFSDKSETKLRVGLIRILSDAECLQLDSLTRIAYFLGNVREEVGYNFNDVENMNYSIKSLKATFRIFRNNPALAARYGRGEGHKANQMMIANNAYANRYGNGSPKSNDGWAYRGAGALQLTFKNNNIAISDFARLKCKQTYPDFITDPGAKISSQYSLVSGALFWGLNNLGKLVTDDKTVYKKTSHAITAKINKYTHSYDKRWSHTKKIAKLLGLRIYE